MIAGALALAVAALFTGAALYVSFCEHPARRGLDDASMLKEWKPAYKRGFAMQAPLALIGCVLGLIAWWQSGDWMFLVAALILVANWPYTLLVIMPTNTALMAIEPAQADARTRALIEKWARLHAGRTALGILATLDFLWALIA